METDSNFDAVNVVIEKLSELVAQNNAVQQDSSLGTCVGRSSLESHLDTSGQRETIDTAKHLIEFVRTENPALSFTRTPTKAPKSEAVTGHVTRSVVKQSQHTQYVKSERSDKTEEEIIVNLPANLGQLNLTNKRTLIESLMNLNASLQEKSDVSTVEKKGDKERTYKCMKCDYCSHNKYYLKQHVELVHNAERPFKCPFCDYAGKRSHSLKEHLVVHSTNRPYECSLCNATFRKKGHLTNHIKMHANAKNFECNICEDKFGDRYLLYDHLRSTHSPDSYYACDFCEYATTIKSNIIMHMHTHGNPKSYKCDKCPYIALHINIMKEHAMGHGLGSTFHEEAVAKKTKPVILLKCSECGFTTDEKALLNDHMLKHISDINLLTSAKSQEKNPHDMTTTMTSGTKGKDQPTAYVCKECDFMSTEAYAFITHMLSHKTKQGSQAITTTSIATTTSSTSETTAMTNSSMTSVQSQRSAPEPPDMSQQWTHDSAVGLYRCTICGYFTKHQRTIKSHIWKHSGHKDIDYPMFQNGPLSVYDDIPIGKTTLVSNNNVIQMQKDQAATDTDDTKDNRIEEEKKESSAVRPSNIALGNAQPNPMQKSGAGRLKKQSPMIEVTGAPMVGSPVTPKAVQITIPSLGNQKQVAASAVASNSASTSVANSASAVPYTTPQLAQTNPTQRKPVIQLVDKSQNPKHPVTVLVSKQSSEQEKIILLTTAADNDGKPTEGRFPTKIHKMVPVQKSISAEVAKQTSSGSVVSQNSNRPVVLIQRRNSIPTEESEQVASAAQNIPGQSTASQTNVSVSQTQYIVNVGESNAPGAATMKEEVPADVEMTTDTSVDEAESFEIANSSQEPIEYKDSIVTQLRKRRLGSSPIGSDGELPEVSAVSSKRIYIEKQDEEGNVVVEKLTPVLSAQPFAISESRGSSPRIPNSPRISEVAAQSDSSTESDPVTPTAATEVTIVETQIVDVVADHSPEIIQSECVVESQVC